jgi:lysozyme
MNTVDFIKKEEGLRLASYLCPASVWTIGYGSTGPDVVEGMLITEPEAEALLEKDMSWALDLMDETVKVPMTANQKTAVVSLAFNIGPGAWRSSTALTRLNNEDYDGTAEAMQWWNKITVNGKKVVSDGLVNRRKREADLFLTA